MKKVFLMVIVTAILVVSLILGGCAHSAPAPTSNPAQAIGTNTTPAAAWPSHISFAGGPANSGAYIRTGALTVLMSKYLKTTASAELVGAPAAQLNTMAAGQAQMCWPQWATAQQAYLGDPAWKGDPVDMRIVVAGPGSAFITVADGNSGINNYSDLKGKKVQVIQPGGTWTQDAFYYLLEAYGMNKTDVTALNWTSFADEMNALDSGAADAGVSGTSPVTLSASYKERDATKPLLWVHTDKDKLQYVVDKMGAQVSIEDFPAGQMKLQPNPEPTLVEYMGIVCSPDVPEDFIYQFMKMAFDEHNDEYLAIKGGIGVYNVQGTIASFGTIPLHDGVIKYLKEKGLWTSDLQAKQDQALANFGKLRK